MTNSKLAAPVDAMDQRYRMAPGIRRQINKVFPSHWSFLLGEIALYSFVVLLISGVYLTLFFDPSMAETTYQGVYQPLRGIEMSKAYEAALDLSFEVRGGLFARQIHHWAALMFVASIMVHLFRVFFTGAFRKPREANWVIGCLLLVLSIAEGFFGYGIPDDLLSGTGLRITSGIILGLPVVGTWMHWAMFGGDWPGTIIIPRIYVLHILLIPGILLALIGAHLALVWYQKHTQFPGPARTEDNVVGVRILPVFALKSAGFFAITFGILAIMGGLFQINAVWNIGPYNPSQVSAGSQPDMYMLWTEGLARIFPNWELYLGNYTIPAVFWVALVAGAMFGLLFIYPFLEAKLTGDTKHHNLLQRPRDTPVRTSLGTMTIAFYLVLMLSGMNDIIAFNFHLSLNATTWIGRIGAIALPPLVYFITYRWCIALQRSDRDVLEHGLETGHIVRTAEGAFIEVHQPLAEDEDGNPIPLEYQGAMVPKKLNSLGAAGRPPAGGWFKADPEDEAIALDEAAHAGEKRRLQVLKERQDAYRAELEGGDSDQE